MELSKIAPLVGIGVATVGGLAYLFTAAVFRIGRCIDDVLDLLLGAEDDD